MDARDLIVTPIWILIIYGAAYLIRPQVTDSVNRVYFFPALTAKIIGALAVGLVYQFYYTGGDTFNYHTYGTRVVWESLWESPATWFRLVFGTGHDEEGLYRYTSRMLFFHDPSSYSIIRIGSIFELFTFSTYSATAVLFGTLGFVGVWMLFLTFYKRYPESHRALAFAALFIPSVFFWGSGLLKDTVTLSCVGIATFQAYRLLVEQRVSIGGWLLLLAALFGLYTIKIYIVLVFVPAAILWIFMHKFKRIKSAFLKFMAFPFIYLTALGVSYFAASNITSDSKKYSIDNLAHTAQQTAYDIRYWTGKDAGSGYSLGELDGTWGSMIRLWPQAVNVSLFRPYVWEVNNPLMLLSALESLGLLLYTLYILLKYNFKISKAFTDGDILFCISFSLVFAFAVGISTYNFGSLVRYKIPMLPFYLIGLILINRRCKQLRYEEFVITQELS